MASFTDMAEDFNTKYKKANYAQLIQGFATVSSGQTDPNFLWTSAEKTTAIKDLAILKTTFTAYNAQSPFKAATPTPETILRPRPKE
jgi:hypothetical protein